MNPPTTSTGTILYTIESELGNLDETEKGAYFEEVTSFVKPFYEKIAQMNQNEVESRSFSEVLKELDDFMKRGAEQKRKLMEVMEVKHLLCPWISLDLSVLQICKYNKMSEDDPAFPLYALHPVIGPECRKFGIFLDQFDTVKEAVIELVWSTVDKRVACLLNVGALPFPLCWGCSTKFGTSTCSKCGVGKFCGRECQVKHWKTHKEICVQIERTMKTSKYGVFRYDL